MESHSEQLIECVGREDCEERTKRYTPTSNLLNGYKEENYNVCTARSRAALDLWSGWLANLTDLDESFPRDMYTTRSEGRDLLTGEDCLGQCCHNHFPSSKNTTGYFVIINRAESSTLDVCAGSPFYVSSAECARTMLSNAIPLEEISTPPNSIFSSYVCMQHVAEWRGVHDLWYCIYFVPVQNV